MRLEVLLDETHAALMASDLPRLALLSSEIDNILNDFPIENIAEMRRLHQKAVDNAALAKAAGRGVRAAIRRLSEVRKNTSQFVTYNGHGKRKLYSCAQEIINRF